MIPGRVATHHGAIFQLLTQHGKLTARMAGRLLQDGDRSESRPAVGDWVAVTPRLSEASATIQTLLPRRSKLSRKTAGQETSEQIVAANVDTVFIVAGLDGDFNPRRIERALILIWDGGARPVIILNKADGCDEVDARITEMEAAAPAVPVHAISCLEDEGLDQLEPYLGSGQTVALLGSSGVGKSTLINRLASADRMAVGAVREADDRGRHTTTHREMILLPGGALVIDNPGIREIQLWDGEAGLEDAFSEIEALSKDCRFTDCSHHKEPDCAVQDAVVTGKLPGKRLSSFRKLQREINYQATRQDARLRQDTKRRWKTITKSIRRMQRQEGR